MAEVSLTEQELQAIIKDAQIRKRLAYKSHQWFFKIYLSHYIKYPFASFHHEMFALTEDEKALLAVIVAFRGSAKSTIVSLSYAIWAIVGVQQRKFVLLLTQTQAQARGLLANIKRELENNELLKADIGPFEEDTDQWAATSIVLSRYNARITVASTEQSVRGYRHGASRPDVIIGDDLEDLSSVKTNESRDKLFDWFVGEVLPAGDINTKTIIIGNLLHEDSLIMRLKNNIEYRRMDGIARSYPILDEDDKPLWLGKYPDSKAIQKEKQKVGSEVSWQREFMLRIIPDDDQIIHQDWIQYYDTIPDTSYFENGFLYSVIAIDLAISEKATADCTAMICAKIFGHGDSLRIYVLPHPFNGRIGFPATVTHAKQLASTLQGNQTRFFIENVGYQQALVDQLKDQGFRLVEGVPVHGQDKRSRLTLTSDVVYTGKVLFPKHGTEDLIQQLVGFGVEKHDDLADAFSILVLKVIELSAKKHHFSFAFVDAPQQPILPDLSNLFNHPWKNEEEREKLEHEADMQIMSDQLQRARNGWF